MTRNANRAAAERRLLELHAATCNILAHPTRLAMIEALRRRTHASRVFPPFRAARAATSLMPPDTDEPARQPRIPRRDPSELPGAAQCWVCLQLEDDERTNETQVLVSLVGAAAYAVCARCGQEAPDGEDEAYRARVRRYLGALES